MRAPRLKLWKQNGAAAAAAAVDRVIWRNKCGGRLSQQKSPWMEAQVHFQTSAVGV